MSAVKQDTLALSISNQLPVLGAQPASPIAQDDEKDDIAPYADKDGILAEHPEGQIPMKYRIMAFAFVVFFSTGAAFAEVTMGPLKSTLVRELGLTSTSISPNQASSADQVDVQFATVSTASNLVNTLLPAIGGITMDYFGAAQQVSSHLDSFS
jgi:hypothetical protein